MFSNLCEKVQKRLSNINATRKGMVVPAAFWILAVGVTLILAVCVQLTSNRHALTASITAVPPLKIVWQKSLFRFICERECDDVSALFVGIYAIDLKAHGIESIGLRSKVEVDESLGASSG